MNLNKKQFDGTFSIFLFIAVIYVVGNFIWWQINTPIIPSWQSALHFNDIFRDGWLFNNGPLLTYIMRFMFFLFGKEYYDLIVIFVNYIFFLIPLYFIYKIGTELKDKETGNIAMILFALVPAIYGMSRQYGHNDYHIIAGITFNIYCLIKTDYFRNRKWTIWYGISVGLGLMIKDAFLAYFFVPFVYIAVAGLREKADNTKIINILTAIAIGSLIAGWHYFRLGIIKKIWYEPVNETVQVFTSSSLSIMTMGLWEELLSPPIFLVFIIGLLFFIFKYRGKYKSIILLWFFIPWAIIMFMPHRKMTEYGLGFIPAQIIIGAILISNIKFRYVKKIILLLLIFVCFLQYLNFSYCTDINLDIKWNPLHYRKENNMVLYNYNFNEMKKYVNCFNTIKKYKNRKFYYIYNYTIDSERILTQMFLNDICFKTGVLDNVKNEMFESDIILFFGCDDPNSIAEDVYKIMLVNPMHAKVFTEEFKKKFLKQINDNLCEIKKNYNKIDELYLDGSQNENIKVSILERKDKFPQFSQ